MKFIRWYVARFPFAFRGLWYAFVHDRSFRWQVFTGLAGVVVITWLAWPLRELEVVLLVLASVLVLITELQNSALETAFDKLHPEQHPSIGVAKDMIAASVLLAVVFAVATTLYVIFF